MIRRTLGRSIVGAILLAGFAISARPAAAQPLTPTRVYKVTITADDAGICPASGPYSLRDAITCANADTTSSDIIEIDIAPGTYKLTYGSLTVTTTVAELWMYGAGASTTIIDGSGNTAPASVFYFTYETYPVTLNGVTVTGGTGQYGGGIDDAGAYGLALNNDVITMNNAGTSGYGGGFYEEGYLPATMTNVVITKNAAEYGGGIAVYNSDGDSGYEPPVLSGTNVTVTYNLACSDLYSSTLAPWDPKNLCTDYGYGGGMYDYQSPVSFTSGGNGIYPITSFSHNTAGNPAEDEGYGGGIYFEGYDGYQTMRLSNVSISWNNGGEYGGGIYNTEGVISGNNVNITNNWTLDYGGGIYNGTDTYSSISLHGSAIEWNTVGGVYSCSQNATSKVFTCTTPAQARTMNACPAGSYTCEWCGCYGAGIYNARYGDVSLTAGRIDRNVAVTNLAFSAPNTTGIYSYGGGIFNDYGTLSLTQEAVWMNQAYDGGGLYNQSYDAVNLSYSKFFGNRAVDEGGAVYDNYSYSLSIDSTQISNNFAGYQTGGVWNSTDGVINESGQSLIAGNISPGICKNTLNPCT